MARPRDLIGIGTFAQRVRLSPRQLRDYDELGLLAPAYVDPDSGYRYYHRGQARSAITIGLLRSLGVPLADIHALLVAERVGPLLERQRGTARGRGGACATGAAVAGSADRVRGADPVRRGRAVRSPR